MQNMLLPLYGGRAEDGWNSGGSPGQKLMEDHQMPTGRADKGIDSQELKFETPHTSKARGIRIM